MSTVSLDSKSFGFKEEKTSAEISVRAIKQRNDREKRGLIKLFKKFKGLAKVTEFKDDYFDLMVEIGNQIIKIKIADYETKDRDKNLWARNESSNQEILCVLAYRKEKGQGQPYDFEKIK